MSLDLAQYDELARDAIRIFWRTRGDAAAASGQADTGNRGAVTAGKNLDGFYDLIQAVVSANGLDERAVYCATQVTTALRHTKLPGFYRPIKDWDVLVVSSGELVAAIELKSQVGSFGNNFNNRSEEAIGMGEDLRVAYREGLLGETARPFVGYLMLLEDTSRSTTPVGIKSHHFEPDTVFDGASYATRYSILCRRLVREGLYDAATLLLSPADSGPNGDYREIDASTGLRSFVARLSARVAESASR